MAQVQGINIIIITIFKTFFNEDLETLCAEQLSLKFKRDSAW